MPLKALIFDVDGTIAETEELHRGAFNSVFEEAGLDWRWDKDLYAELVKVEGGPERMRAYVERYRPRDLARLENGGVFDVLQRRKSERFLSRLEGGSAPLRPGVGRLLKEARAAGVRLGVVTTSRRENFEVLILNRFGFEALDWFRAVITREEVSRLKPDPEAYEKALEALGVRPGEAMVLEDTGRGVRAATAAGVSVVATPSQYSRGDDFAGASLVLSDLGEPADPFEVLAGDPMGHSWVDIDLLRRLAGAGPAEAFEAA